MNNPSSPYPSPPIVSLVPPQSSSFSVPPPPMPMCTGPGDRDFDDLLNTPGVPDLVKIVLKTFYRVSSIAMATVTAATAYDRISQNTITMSCILITLLAFFLPLFIIVHLIRSCGQLSSL